ncbi:hypothetical protein M1247_34310 [Mycobacterium sp. 21AC1]|uniref:hypothetical protein n=1 Tax=[Mycobacterium] appelbergii TaxID=2939269 RepID=UPI0029393CEA|nr:hypothetical protein [Mycobacterium sp. 21AC1]MDV3130020.1 hypothetical protein [Mycobacterium sp. 21AC1]
MSEPTEPIPLVAPEPQESRSNPIEGRNGIGWLVCAGVAGVAIAWFILFSPGELGSKSEWFFGAVVFAVVMVTMWQTLNIQRQARQDVADAAERLQRELAAADERAALELALTQKWHRAEMESRQRLHRAELEAQRQLARVERAHLHEHMQKQAMIEVSRAVGAQTRMLATLWSEGARVLGNDDRDVREQAMNAIFEQISQVVNDVGVELDNAHLLSEDDRLHQALDQINEAVLMGIRVAEDVHAEVVEGRTPQPNPIPAVQRLMHERASEARRLAWALLRTGLSNNNG